MSACFNTNWLRIFFTTKINDLMLLIFFTILWPLWVVWIAPSVIIMLLNGCDFCEFPSLASLASQPVDNDVSQEVALSPIRIPNISNSQKSNKMILMESVLCISCNNSCSKVLKLSLSTWPDWGGINIVWGNDLMPDGTITMSMRLIFK